MIAGGDGTDTLIGAGEIESGVADALCPERDGWNTALSALREASLAAARFLLDPAAKPAAGAALRALAALDLPARVEVSVPEGYAYYGLFPETYAGAARRFYEEERPERVAVAGIRSIGAGLSAVAAAALEACGCEVRSWTVRPRGHPFYRSLALSAELEREIRSRAAWHFAIVDEGPGLSGSSFACIAEELVRLGVPEDRIVFLPSWDPEPEGLLSEAARARWARHRKYPAPFRPAGGLLDFSAGEWRRTVCPAGREWPAVQPQHERRKYLDGDTLLKFAGLGPFGQARLERARELAEAGFSPRAAGLERGFLRLEFIPGHPLDARDRGPDLLAAMARYLAHLRRHHACGGGVSFDELLRMIATNTGLDAARLERFRGIAAAAPAVAIDGRMLPHEWLRTASGYLKTDSLDHHDGHFLPGRTDIAWDLAGASVEFDLGAAEAARLVETYAEVSGDRDAGRRLPFFTIAYLAFRLGYAALAQAAIRGSDDAARFAALSAYYRARLQAAIRSAEV